MKPSLESIHLVPKTLEEATEIIVQLVKVVRELKEENELLREKLNNNSNNSSLPPSQDRDWKAATRRGIWGFWDVATILIWRSQNNIAQRFQHPRLLVDI